MCVGAQSGGGGLGAASLIGQAAGAVTTAVGSYFGAASAKMGLELNSYFSTLNSQLEHDNARESYREGQFQEQQVDLNAAQIKSSERAAMGSDGVDMSTGSALNRLNSTDYMASMDRITVEQNAARAAAGYNAAASSYASEAGLQKAAANGISPFLSGLTSLIGSAGKVSQDWYRLSKVGAFGGQKQTLGGSYIQGHFGAIGQAG